MPEQTVGDVLEENCQDGDDVMVCNTSEGTKVIEEPESEAMNAPATDDNLEKVFEHKEITQ